MTYPLPPARRLRYVARLKYVVVNKRTALTRQLARRLLRSHSAGNSNPTDMAAELSECAAARDRSRRRPQAKQDAHNAARHRHGGAGA